jgi:signal transduction histidine kinase/ligand-binding sensor domain-containing protein/DNA-binding response OmpR family regulator
LLTILLCTIENAFAIYFKHIGMREGISQVSVMSIYQDELGRMWFGSMEGLSMYDGENVQVFKHSESAADLPVKNETFPIVGDRQGNIFFRSDDLLIHYDIREQQFKCIKDENVTTVYCHNRQVWVGAGDSLYIWNIEENKFHFLLKTGNLSPIQKIFVDSKSQLWIGTANGLFRIDNSYQPVCLIPSEDIYEIMEDSHSNLWIATRTNGMYVQDRNGKITKFVHDPMNPNTLSSDHIRCFAEDNFGNIWIGTFNGLDVYNPHTNRFTVYRKEDLPGSLQHSSIFSTFKDSQGSIWVGTYYGGVHYFNPETDIFTYYPDNRTRDDCLSHFFVGHMIEDKNQNVWICTEGGGLNFFDRKKKRFKHYSADEANANSIVHNNLKCISYSEEYDRLYIGTHTGGLSIYDINEDRFRNFKTRYPDYYEIAGDVIHQTMIYNGLLIILSRNGFFKLDLKTEKLSPLFKIKQPTGSKFLIDSKGYLWIAQSGGIAKINLHNESDETTFPNNEKGLGSLNVSCMYEDTKGRMFFGTNGSGLYYYDETNGTFTGYTSANSGLPSDYCYHIVQSRQGYLIISSDKGLTFFAPDQHTVKTVNLETALPISGINTGCGMLVCQNGEIFAGGIDGATSFFEQDLFSSAKDYKIYFSTLYINNELACPNHPKGVLKEALPFTDRIVLTHKQNNLIFTYASNNYINTLNNTDYEYKLDGFDEKWIPNNGRNISYTNLNPGKYTLIIRERQNGQDLIPRAIRMEIIIKSPFYATPLFYFLYIVIGTGLLYGYYRFKKNQILLQTSLKLERKEKEKIEEINQAKLQFFANISHEFRTPLTLIITQTDLLLQNSSIPPFIYNKLLRIRKNTKHMRNLINELLDFRKLEQGHMKLKVYEQNIIPFLKEIYLSFYEYASSLSITYLFHAPEKALNCRFDPIQMQKVFYNLLSNAFKYTNAPATIEMSVEEDADAVTIKIIDTGIGIAKEDIHKIFDRFYQADNAAFSQSQLPSTGIGLSVVKNIIELHHGSIQVESTPGYGSIFIVRILKGKGHFDQDEYIVDKPESPHVQEVLLPPSNNTEDDDANTPITLEDGFSQHDFPVILLVEDNEELLSILKDLFMPVYRVITAVNGKEGLQKAKQEKPSIIVSDIMMPGMSGTEMCMKIKNDFDLCHIPVVLLTALSSIEQNIEGLQRGADDYISKPFNEKTLVARCNNLVRNRIILQKKFSQQMDFDSLVLANNPIDQRFLDTVNHIIEQNFDNTQFDMTQLAEESGLSRSSLYTKFKALTGITPNDYVLNRKLKKAAWLLKNKPELQIAEISDQLGFGSPRYFSRCFKELYQVSPIEYRKK